jgi:hypothetical protein
MGSLSMPGWEPSGGMKARNRRIDESTAQAILNCKGQMGAAQCVDKMNDPKVTIHIVKSIWRRLRWAHLQQQFDAS